MRRINLGDIVKSGNDIGEVCFVSTHYFCICVRMGEIAFFDVKVVVSRILNDFEIIRKVDNDSLESVTKEIEKKYMYNRVRSNQKWRVPYVI
tara:strand:+ start:819 stop:1094 length:276 start_codon:yes stop_codon:yes gene_type:complete